MNYVKSGVPDKIFDIANHLFFILISLVMLYPFWQEICISLSSGAEATRGGFFLLPRQFTAEAYSIVMGTSFIWTAYGNSIFTTVLATVLGVFFTSLTAYPMSKRKLPGNKIITFMVVFSMIFSGGIIPTYIVVNKIGLINSLWALILVPLIGPFNTIVVRNFFEAIPEEIEESAFMDGANPLRIFFTIILPLSKPVLATVSLWIAVFTWNNFMGALIYLNDRNKYTLPRLIRDVIAGQMFARETGEGGQLAIESVIGATIVATVLPIMCIYPFLQKYFVKGVMIGSVKG
jgi:putative aldouronate transport system permease protein